MKTFKKPISIVLALLMAVSVLVVAPVTADAGSNIQMFNIWGDIYSYGDYNYEYFTLSAKTKVTFELASSTTGDYKLEVENEYGSVVFSKEDTAYGSEKITYVTTLAAGDYTAYIYNNNPDGESLYYDFYGYRYYNPPKNPTKLRLNKSKIALCRSGSYQLNATYSPSDVTSKLKFKSSNTKVAKVNSSGYVTAKNLGVTTITATMGNKKAKCTVVVNNTYVEMAANKKKNLVGYINKISGYKKAKWSSSKKSIVEVDKKGQIKTKKHGISKITAKVGSRKYTITVYSYSKAGVKKRVLNCLKDLLYVPQSLKVGKVTYPAYNACKIYYSAYNIYGEIRYNAITGYMKKDILYYYFDH